MRIIDHKKHSLAEMQAAMSARCLELGLSCEVPALINARVDLAVESLVVEWGSNSERTVMLEITMPCGEAKLLWLPWPPSQPRPNGEPGQYQHLNYNGAWQIMPRRTKCYDNAYDFAGQVHPIEPVTPPEITALYETTSQMFDLQPPAVPNMCLENWYANGREKIAEHSDDLRQFGALKDVYCWTTGNARPAVFSSQRSPGKTRRERELVTVALPAGLYVMRGPEFQRRYTHEFPSLHHNFFKWLCRQLAESGPAGFPDEVLSEKGASLRGVVQARWISEHRVEAEALIRQKSPEVERHLEALSDWCCVRVSYTLRNFTRKPEDLAFPNHRETR